MKDVYIVHMRINLLHTWTYYRLVETWEHWFRNTWMSFAHIRMCIWEHGNNLWERRNLMICIYESGELWELYRLPCCIHNTHLIHFFLVLYIELAILTWSLICHTSLWIGQQEMSPIWQVWNTYNAYMFVSQHQSLPLRSSWVHRDNNIGTISM